VARGRLSQTEVGFLYLGSGMFRSDRQAQPLVSDASLRAAVTHTSVLTYTCTPPGSGQRIGLDRDLDGFYDGDERAAGSNPADPHSTP
jgi:hypothetical protein